MAIYLDHNATTPCDPRVVRAMLPYFGEVFANPANGLHPLGRQAARAVEAAREQVAALIGASAGEIVFTSGATESNHLAILGAAAYAPPSRRKVITCAVEHKAVLLPFKRLEAQGFAVTLLPVDADGRVLLAELERHLDERTFLVSIQAANNETGVLQPVREVAALAHQVGALCHTDAAQAVGKIPCDVEAWGIDLLSMSAHKLYGPKGIGALYVRGGARALPLRPLLEGGGQEAGVRAGTLNVPAIVGFGEACRICREELGAERARIQALRDRFERGLLAALPSARINAQGAPRLPNTSSLTVPGIEADALLLNLPEVMMGVGAACASGAVEPSHVLLAMGLSRKDAYATIRASLGRFNTEAEIDRAIVLIAERVLALRRGG
ncbi:MAG: cysteine desulfurase [Thermoflexales bacterium]|nr:cysteine desulfurase [Thermoflexales bacterium]